MLHLLQALRKFLKRLFLEHPSHRTLTLHTLSLLNTSLPRLGLLTLDFVESLVSCLSSHHSVSFSPSALRLSSDHTSKKVTHTHTRTHMHTLSLSLFIFQESVASELSGQTPKTSISSGLPSSPIPPMASPEEESELLQLALSLLLNVRTLSFPINAHLMNTRTRVYTHIRTHKHKCAHTWIHTFSPVSCQP